MSSFFDNKGREIMFSLALIFIISICVLGAAFFLGKYVLYRWVAVEQKKVLCFATLISNCAFLGNPVVESIYGLASLAHVAVFLLPIRIALWTVGLSIFTGARGQIHKILIHPCMLGTYIGLIFMLSGWSPPALVRNLTFSIGNCTTPFSMIVVGHTLAKVNPRSLFTKTVVYFTVVRLLLLPLSLLGALILFRVEPMTAGIAVVLTGMPAPANVSIMANKYGSDSELASKIIFFSTLLSMVTVPAMVLLARKFI
jgi:predicted permease